MGVPLREQAQLERRNWARFGDAKAESDGDSVTVRAVEDIPFERVRLTKSTQEEKKTAVDVATALAMGDKSAVGTRCCPRRNFTCERCNIKGITSAVLS